MLNRDADGKAPRLLIASDETDLGTIYSRHLKSAPVEVIGLVSVTFLLSAGEDLNPDIIRVCMPSLSDVSLFQSLRAVLPRVKLAVVGESLNDSDIRFLMTLGATGYVNRKDSHPKDVINLVISQLIS